MKAILIISIMILDPATSTTQIQFSTMPACQEAMRNVARSHGFNERYISWYGNGTTMNLEVASGLRKYHVSLACVGL